MSAEGEDCELVDAGEEQAAGHLAQLLGLLWILRTDLIRLRQLCARTELHGHIPALIRRRIYVAGSHVDVPCR
ncbi:hypothetical protein [Streptomyces ortus]|uniref:Uncharacterized protein n=1 Tax=Streptomyces ortus TaxID=2867268 RepID=A0ABT3V411_9ACTN|nr:hypothetical protein [Streptomyces ortus]MCX4234727.1 hypothetical protein [Streptomyces ortus]